MAELIEQVNEHLGGYQDSLPNLDAEPLPNFVYHYTDVGGLIGILSSKRLWATDYRFLNDSSELEYTTDVAREIAARDFGGRHGGLAGAFVAHISDASRPGVYLHTPYYLTCFSEQDNSLSQWRAYGGKQGFALQLPGDISTARGYEASGRQNPGITLVKVIYDRTFHEAYLSRLIEQLVALCQSDVMRRAEQSFNFAELMTAFLPFYWGQIDRASYRFKHPDFESEREWRMVRWGNVHPERYRQGVTVVPYIEIGLDSVTAAGAPLPLVGVRHGPSPLPDQTLHSLDRILSTNGYPPESCPRTGSDTPARL